MHATVLVLIIKARRRESFSSQMRSNLWMKLHLNQECTAAIDLQFFLSKHFVLFIAAFSTTRIHLLYTSVSKFYKPNKQEKLNIKLNAN